MSDGPMFELIPEVTGRFLAVKRRKWDHSIDTLDPVVMVTCPFCGEEHVHGVTEGRSPPGPPPGLRVAPCLDPKAARKYFITTAE